MKRDRAYGRRLMAGVSFVRWLNEALADIASDVEPNRSVAERVL